MDSQKKLNLIISFIYTAIILFSVYFIFKLLLSPLLPFITAFIIISISRKFIIRIEDKVHSTKITSFIFTLSLISLISVLIYTVFYIFFSELTNLIQNLNNDTLYVIRDKLISKTERIFGGLFDNRIFLNLKKILPGSETNIADSIASTISSFAPKLLSFLMSFLSFFPSAIIFVGILFISTYYIGCDYEKICNFFLLQMSEKAKDTYFEAKGAFTSTAKELFKSYFVLTLITFIQLFIGLSIIGVDYALILSSVICFIDFLPILGTGTILIPWAVICFFLDNYRYAIGLIVLYGIITLFRQIAEPKIVGTNIGLSPLLSLISIFVGLKLMGFIGIIVFPILIMTLIRLNEKGLIKIYKNFPEKNDEILMKTKIKFLRFKRNDK